MVLLEKRNGGMACESMAITRLPVYHNRTDKEKSWVEITSVLKIPVECKKLSMETF